MKEWNKPELIVLGRGAPEENVLCNCKRRPEGKHANACSRKMGCFLEQTSRYVHS